EVVLACCWLGVALNIQDRVWAGRSASVLVATMSDLKTSVNVLPSLVQALVAVSGRLDAGGASKAADALFAPLRDPNTSVHARYLLAQALVAVSVRLDADGASKAADALLAAIRDPKNVNQFVYLAQALGA